MLALVLPDGTIGQGDRTLGGKALDCRVTQMTNQGSLAIGDVTYHTAEFNVTVIAAG